MLNFLSNIFSNLMTVVIALVCAPIALACAGQVCRALKHAIAAYSERRVIFALGKVLRIALFSYIMKIALAQVVKFPIIGGLAAFAICIAFVWAVIKVLRDSVA